MKGTKLGNQKKNLPNRIAQEPENVRTACFSFLGKVIKTNNDQGTILCIQRGSSKLKGQSQTIEKAEIKKTTLCLINSRKNWLRLTIAPG
jgi:hypothetical protein